MKLHRLTLPLLVAFAGLISACETSEETTAMMTPAPTGGAAMTDTSMTDPNSDSGMETPPPIVPPGTTTMAVCEARLEVGDTCDPANDCCPTRGASCQPISETEAKCLRDCDANAAAGENGCEQTELCVPFNQNAPAGMPSPGACLLSDNCQPGNENLACGEGNFNCARRDGLTICAEVPAAAMEVGVGENCDFEATVCADGLICEYGVCSSRCSGGAACAEGEECLDFSNLTGLDWASCVSRCDHIAQDCAEGVCIITDIVQPYGIVGTCVSENGGTTLTVGDKQSGEACTEDPNTYWGDCQAGLCQPLEEGGAPTCLGFCDEDNLTPCQAGSACFIQDSGLGLCFGECDPLNNTGCADGDVCSLVNEGFVDRDGVATKTMIGFCQAAPATPVATGQTCMSDETSGVIGNCQAGNICIQTAMGAPSQCVQLCEVGAATSTCAEGTTCMGVNPAFSTYIGICQ